MTRIETDVPDVIVEIEGSEYRVAARTVDTMDRLIEAGKANAGKPNYRLWLAELEILLGREACADLFTAGRLENVDRLQMIYSGVVKAFQHTDEEISASIRERDIQAVATALAPVNELLRNIKAMEKKTTANVREIPRA